MWLKPTKVKPGTAANEESGAYQSEPDFLLFFFFFCAPTSQTHANYMQTTIPACCACLVYIYCMFGALYDSVSPLNTAAKASVHLAESAVINHKTICTIKDDGVIYLTVLRQDTPGNNIQIDVRVGKYF